MRITTTPNNPESSRSHLFIAIKFSGDGQLTLIDMLVLKIQVKLNINF